MLYLLIRQGVFEVRNIHHNEIENAKLLEYAVLAACASFHSVSKSLQKTYGKSINCSCVTNIQGISGKGIRAKEKRGFSLRIY